MSCIVNLVAEITSFTPFPLHVITIDGWITSGIKGRVTLIQHGGVFQFTLIPPCLQLRHNCQSNERGNKYLLAMLMFIKITEMPCSSGDHLSPQMSRTKLVTKKLHACLFGCLFCEGEGRCCIVCVKTGRESCVVNTSRRCCQRQTFSTMLS